MVHHELQVEAVTEIFPRKRELKETAIILSTTAEIIVTEIFPMKRELKDRLPRGFGLL